MRSPSSSPASVEVARHHGDLESLHGAWATLVDAGHPGAPFRSAAWLTSWWNRCSPSGEPYLLVARRGSEIIGILPLYAQPSMLGGRRLRFLGDGVVGSDYLGVVARSGDAQGLAYAFAEWLAARNEDELELDGLDAEDFLLDALRVAHGPRLVVEPRFRCPLVRFDGSWSVYLESLPDGLGQQWRRRKKWLEKRPGYRVDVLRSPAEIAVGVDVLFDLHEQRWAIEGGSDALDGESTRAFHREAAKRLAALDWARIFVLHAEGAPRAALYGFRHGDRFAYYQSGYEPAWRQRSVGTVLLGQVMKWCFEEGLVEFDFLHGTEEYKLRWATGWRETVRARVIGEGLRPWLAARGRETWWELRARVKDALPDEVLSLLRRTKKRLRSAA
jgi:CelD/BcsL family acetyltransferase involved in cellulose biosynthesis